MSFKPFKCKYASALLDFEDTAIRANILELENEQYERLGLPFFVFVLYVKSQYVPT